jgi:hypothetical protein
VPAALFVYTRGKVIVESWRRLGTLDERFYLQLGIQSQVCRDVAPINDSRTKKIRLIEEVDGFYKAGARIDRCVDGTTKQ